MKNEIILYRPNDLAEHIEVRFEEDTIWLTQTQIAELFCTKRPAITKHLKNIFQTRELVEDEVSSKMEHTTRHGAIEGKVQTGVIKVYNLDAILSVGYRVNSKNATIFRRWATEKLKDYLLKGYAINNRMNRIDENTLMHLTKKNKGVKVTLLTKSISKQLSLDVQTANTQYGDFDVKKFTQSHDRFLIIDNGKEVYHIGASLKDLGKKWFAFSKMNKESVSSILSAISGLI